MLNPQEESILATELQAATTEGYSMHIGMMYGFLLMMKFGATARGIPTRPTTFSIIVSALCIVRPPDSRVSTSRSGILCRSFSTRFWTGSL